MRVQEAAGIAVTVSGISGVFRGGYRNVKEETPGAYLCACEHREYVRMCKYALRGRDERAQTLAAHLRVAQQWALRMLDDRAPFLVRGVTSRREVREWVRGNAPELFAYCKFRTGREVPVAETSIWYALTQCVEEVMISEAQQMGVEIWSRAS